MATTLTPTSTPTERPGRLAALRAAAARTARGTLAEPPAADASSPEPTRARLVAGTVALLGALLAAFAGYLLVGSSFQANRQQDVMYQDLRADLAAMTVPFAGAIAPGTPLGVVSIPSIGLDQVFVEGSTSEQTRSGPGLKRDSVLPGQAGLSVLVGHRTTMGAAFGDLDRLAPGDTIDVTTGQGRFRYVVDLVRTSDAPSTQVAVVPSRLTLVTSDPAYAPYRNLMVSARLRGTALPATTGGVAVAADVPGQGSSAGLVPLLLWSQLLLLTTVAVSWLAIRRSGPGLWIGAVPVLLAILWQVFEDLALLLPNTL